MIPTRVYDEPYENQVNKYASDTVAAMQAHRELFVNGSSSNTLGELPLVLPVWGL